MRVAVVIPALNEAGNIGRLVGEIPHDAADQVDVFVVDNGSTDATAEEACSAGANVVNEPRRGYGYACAAGVAAIVAADAVVFLDGDGSFEPAEMSSLLVPLAENRAGLVLGTRMKGGLETGAMPPHQMYGNRLVSALMSALYAIQVSDLGPYRAIRFELLRSLDMREMTFGWPTEMMVKVARQGARIVEVPITYRRRWSGQSKVSGTVHGTLFATYHIVGTTLRYAIGRKMSRKI